MALLPSRGGRLAGGVILSAVLLAACGDPKGGGGHPGFGGPPPQVSVMTVKTQTLPVSFEYTGQTQGSNAVPGANPDGQAPTAGYKDAQRNDLDRLIESSQ